MPDYSMFKYVFKCWVPKELAPNRREKVHRRVVLYKVLKRIIMKNKQTKKCTNISKEKNNYKD